MTDNTPAVPAIAAEKYVRLTTFTKDGRRKHAPVWIAPLSDGTLGFTTELESWKVKRIGNNPAVELAPCNARGVVDDDAPTTEGTAVVLTDDEAVQAAIQAKYGYQVTLIGWLNKARALIGKAAGDRCAVVISPVDE